MTTTSDVGTGDRYAFDNSTDDAADQVRYLAEILDRHTRAVLERLGAGPGWQCLDLGAGAGSVTGWLAQRVGPDGGVLALDQDPRHIGAHELVEARVADIRTADLGEAQFDLVHARLLLMHLPNREEVLGRIFRALKPGGLVVLSEWDCTHLDEMLVRGSAALAESMLAFQEALIGQIVDNGASADWAKRLAPALYDAGFTEVEAETYNRVWSGGEAGCLLHASNSRQIEPVLTARGVTQEQLVTLREGMADPATLAWQYLMVTAVGRRPAE
jgi:SAM-dependent methyltransferase